MLIALVLMLVLMSLVLCLSLKSDKCEPGFRKRSFISPVRPTVHSNPSRKQSFSKTLFKAKENHTGLSFLGGQKTF